MHGVALFLRQVKALTGKNFRLQMRNKSSTATQLLIGIFFLLLLLIMDSTVRKAKERDQTNTYTAIPKSVSASNFTHCDVGGNTDCFDFVYGIDRGMLTQQHMIKLEELVANIRSITGSKETATLYVGSKMEMNEWILANPNKTLAAIYFVNAPMWMIDTTMDIMYTLRVNTTKSCAALGVWGCNDPIAEVAIPLQLAVDSAILKTFGSSANADPQISAQFSDFPHPDMPTNFDVVEAYGPTFLYIAASFNYVIQLTLIVEEKELHLVEAMKQMGMLQGAYWTSWLLTNCVINTVMVALLVAFGAIFQLELFKETALGLLLTFFWISSMSFTSMAFLFSTFTRSTSTARLLGIGIFIITFIASPLIVQLILMDGSESYDGARSILSLFPVFSFYHVLTEFISKSSGTTNTGMSWNDRTLNLLPVDPTNSNGGSDWSIKNSFEAMLIGILVMCVLAWYLEHVIPTEHGHRESVVFFLKPSYWFPSHASKQKGKGGSFAGSTKKVKPAVDDTGVDADVLAEAQCVRDDKFDGRDIAVKVRQLSKTFYMSGIPFEAVRNIEYAIDKDSTFVMLGHNGAGKSTSINMLTGLSDVTSGDAEIFGHSVVHEMPAIQSIMGVCPQHDILWDKLTGREHLRLFAMMKGVDSEKIEEEVEKRLNQTLLTDAANRPSWTYSGGMKRRLSIAIALIGDPRIVFLDEPTTGMDPLTRREVWNMIAEAKKGRVIFLTTHSMEEADCLGDRIAVMSHGRIQAIGSSVRLKNKFGSGYQMTILLNDDADSSQSLPSIQTFFDSSAPKGTGKVTANLGGILTVELPAVATEDTPGTGTQTRTDVDTLVQFFKEFEMAKSKLLVKDYSLNQCTLETVFLRLSEMDKFIENPGKEQQQANAQSNLKQGFVERDIGTAVQFNALFRKSLRYQCAHRMSCFCVIMFPVFIMLLLVLLELAVFSSLRLRVVCGEGITKDECKSKGYDLQCVEMLFTHTTPSAPEAKVGVISLNGRYGGINPNCNSDGCFTNLEQPSVRDIPTFASVGAEPGKLDLRLSETDDQQLRDWYLNVGFLLQNETCDNIYNEHFDEAKVCKDSSALQKKSCQDRVRELQNTKAYIEADYGNKTTGAALSICARSSTGEAFKATPANIATVQTLTEVWSQCKTDNFLQVLRHLGGREDWQPSEKVNSTTGSFSRSGILGSYTSAIFQDEISKLVDDMSTILTGMSLDKMCKLDRHGVTSYLFNITNGNIDEVSILAAVENMCLFITDLDVLRGLSFNISVGNAESFRKDSFLDVWGGVEAQTDLMKEKSDSLTASEKYRERYFLSHWQGYEFHNVDDAKMEYNYTSFFNNSGTGGGSHGNWQATVWAMNNAIIRSHLGRSIYFMVEKFPSNFTCNRDDWLSGKAAKLDCDLLPMVLRLSILDFIALQLFPYLLMIHMFLLVGIVVYEKENRLRMIMKMMGLSMRVYWVVNYLFYLAQYLMMVALMWLMGTVANLQLFVLHDAAVVFLFLFSWGNLLVIFSFFLSVFFKSSRTSTAAIFLFMLIMNTTGFNLIDTFTQDPNTPESTFVPLMFFPPLVMIRALYWFGVSAAFKEPITTENFSTYGGGQLKTCISLMWVHIFVFSILVWYLDNVLTVGYGIAKSPLFFLQKDFWFPSKPDATQLANSVEALAQVPLPSVVNEEKDIPADVQAEYKRILSSDESKGKPVLRAVRLHKQFKEKLAVRSFSLGVNEKECFALLGHNGAGKTTTINLLTGLFEPTSGTALVDGFSIRTEMGKIYQRMGVCPQHDILWDSLNGYDHLRFYGRLKGLSGVELESAVVRALNDVNLMYAAKRPAGKYSGGMKRRLSTAISILGNPKIVYLDEPSTGLDPASRHQLWSVISNAKGDKSIVLTSHSMEEVEVLSDRIGIMADGLFQCIGTATELKHRYGNGYSCFVTTKDRTENAHRGILEFVKGLFPSAKLRNEQLAGTSNFEIPRDEVVLSSVFEQFEQARSRFGITDWSISESTLEDVFLRLAKEADAKSQG